MPQYEVWCHHCNVTFPPQTKVCLHCGSRTRRERPPSAMQGRREIEPVWDTDPVTGLVSFRAGQHPAEMVPPDRLPEPEQEPARRSLLRAGMSLLWMILLVAGYLWQTCSGG